MIQKPTILITSTGRTGTEFFAKLFSDLIPDCTSLHEPDIVKFPGVKNRFELYADQTRRAGIWRMFILKGLGQWTLARLSDERFSGKLPDNEARTRLETQRRSFVENMPGSLYVESNLGFYGLLDLLPDVFNQHRVVYIVRDGRDWVRSMMNWGEVYGKTGFRKLFAHAWPEARQIANDPLAREWLSLSRFERLCWAWWRLNEFALDKLPHNPNARFFHFEKIFTGADKYQYLHELVEFATDLPGVDKAKIGSTEGWLERKVHQSADSFPSWEEWSPHQQQCFRELCGPLMERLGYAF